MRLFVGSSTNLLRELVNLRDDVRDLLERAAEVSAEVQALVHDVRALIHVLHRFASFFLNALDEVGNLFCRGGGFLSKLADFVGNDGESQAVFACACRFNGSVECKKVGLLSQIVDDLDDLANVVSTLAEDGDDARRNADGL